MTSQGTGLLQLLFFSCSFFYSVPSIYKKGNKTSIKGKNNLYLNTLILNINYNDKVYINLSFVYT